MSGNHAHLSLYLLPWGRCLLPAPATLLAANGLLGMLLSLSSPALLLLLLLLVGLSPRYFPSSM